MKKICTATYTMQAYSYLDYLGIEDRPEIRFEAAPRLAECMIEKSASVGQVIFNTSFFEGLDAVYASLIFLHELYHITVQQIKYKRQVTVMRDDKKWEWMQKCDIEADLQVVIYLKSIGTINSFEEYCTILHKGASVFRDQHIRRVKLERFIGSLTSIRAYYSTGQKVIYLPELSYNQLMLESVHYDRCHLGFQLFTLDECDLLNWQVAFQEASLISCQQYVELLESLTREFLLLIDKLKDYAA